MAELTTDPDLRERVRERYAEAARSGSCCGGVELRDQAGTQVFGDSLYTAADTEGAVDEAVGLSFGCGVPTAVADLHEGETVLDLGSGAGADVLISARRVGPTGRAYGLDMTDEMLALARANAAAAGAENAEFLKGYIEAIPLPDASVDVVISNCVINLAGDKAQGARRGRARAAPGRPLRGLRRHRRPRHGRGDARRHGGLDRLHRGRAHARGVRARARGRGLRRHRDHRDPPRPRARRLGDRPRAQALRARVAHALFVCLHNAGRSQMSEALFELAARGRHTAASAGTAPAERVHPEVVEVMRERGVDLSARTPRKLTRELAERADVVVTMGCGDECPYIPGKRYLDWDLEDPKGRSVEEVRATRDDIARRVSALVEELDASPA